MDYHSALVPFTRHNPSLLFHRNRISMGPLTGAPRLQNLSVSIANILKKCVAFLPDTSFKTVASTQAYSRTSFPLCRLKLPLPPDQPLSSIFITQRSKIEQISATVAMVTAVVSDGITTKPKSIVISVLKLCDVGGTNPRND